VLTVKKSGKVGQPFSRRKKEEEEEEEEEIKKKGKKKKKRRSAAGAGQRSGKQRARRGTASRGRTTHHSTGLTTGNVGAHLWWVATWDGTGRQIGTTTRSWCSSTTPRTYKYVVSSGLQEVCAVLPCAAAR